MSKFLKEKTASMALGNTCAGCATHRHDDGFVNTNLDVLGRGRIYFCAGCVFEMAREVGCLSPDQVGVLHGQMDEMAETLERASKELAQAKANMVVPLGDVIDFLDERAKRRPEEPAPVQAGA